MTTARNLCVCLVLLLCATTAHASSIILNGDFESNSAGGTMFNMSNATFNTTVSNATAFGTAQEIDLVTSTDFGIAPESGKWKLGLHTQGAAFGGFFDAFSFNLSSGVVIGNSYDLEFFGALFSGLSGTIDIGLSSSSTSFGALVFSGSPASPTAWTQFNSTFIAPVNASFLTVRSTLTPDRYAFVDNFSLQAHAASAVPEPSTLLLFGAGLAAVPLRRRLKKRT